MLNKFRKLVGKTSVLEYSIIISVAVLINYLTTDDPHFGSYFGMYALLFLQWLDGTIPWRLVDEED